MRKTKNIYLLYYKTKMEEKNWIYICHYDRGNTSISDRMTLAEVWACLEVVVRKNQDCVNAQIIRIND